MADVFLTVLYARTGVGLISPWLSDWTWRGFRMAGNPLPQKMRDRVLSIGGPAIIVVTIVMWVALLVVGFGLHPSDLQCAP